MNPKLFLFVVFSVALITWGCSHAYDQHEAANITKACKCDPCLCVDCKCTDEAPEMAETPVMGQQYFPPLPIPPVPDAGLDPIGQMLSREREERLSLERRLDRVETLNSIQIRQIAQLQKIVFGFGVPGQVDASKPIGTPPALTESTEVNDAE